MQCPCAWRQQVGRRSSFAKPWPCTGKPLLTTPYFFRACRQAIAEGRLLQATRARAVLKTVGWSVHTAWFQKMFAGLQVQCGSPAHLANLDAHPTVLHRVRRAGVREIAPSGERRPAHFSQATPTPLPLTTTSTAPTPAAMTQPYSEGRETPIIIPGRECERGRQTVAIGTKTQPLSGLGAM